MAVNRLFLESAAGEHVAGANLGPLDGAWPTAHEGGFPLLQGLDPGGFTLFNRMQAFGLEEELSRLRSTINITEQRSALDSAINLVRRCQRGEKLYLRFEGE